MTQPVWDNVTKTAVSFFEKASSTDGAVFHSCAKKLASLMRLEAHIEFNSNPAATPAREDHSKATAAANPSKSSSKAVQQVG